MVNVNSQLNSIKNICFRCGIEIESGGLFYHVDLQITSGFDGIIHEIDDMSEAEKTLRDLTKIGLIQAEEDVHKEMNFTLCRLCKDKLIKSIVGEDRDQINRGSYSTN